MALYHPKEVYYLSLGKFIHYFSAVESEAISLLWHISGLPDDTARVAFSGVRATAAKDMINKFRQLQGLVDDPLLTRAWAQFSDITYTRNHMLHYEQRFDPGPWTVTVSNHTQRLPGKDDEMVISPTILDQMSADLHNIEAALKLAQLPDRSSPPAAKFEQRASAPWQYKRPPLSPSETPSYPRRS